MVETGITLMTLDEFMQRYSDEGPFEVVGGEIVPVTPQVTRSARIAGRLFRKLADYVETHKLGEAFIEAPFVLTIDAKWVKGSRVPDVMFIAAARLAQLAEDDPDWDSKPLPLVPDLVIEVISPTDRLADVTAKIAGYLDDGVRMVWLIEPEAQTVTIYTPGSKQLTRLTAEDTLSGGDIVPGFELPLNTLFA
jgi:Uma2 family endonuclease